MAAQRVARLQVSPPQNPPTQPSTFSVSGPATGKPQVDDKNSNPALARRSIIGLSLFIGMRPAGADKWSGQIYNADDGKTYASSVSVAGPGTLKVEGVGAFCGGETWTRAAR